MGFFSGIFGDGGKSQVKKGYFEGEAKVAPKYDLARTEIGGGYDKAQGYYDPYLQQGQAGNELYAKSIGAYGNTDAERMAGQRSFMDSYQADPSQQYVQQGIARQDNARGNRYSGAHYAASARAHNEGINTRRNQLLELSRMGQQFAGMSGQNAVGKGTALGQLDYGEGLRQAGAVTGMRNAFGQIQQNRQTNGVNALSTLGGSALKAFGGPAGAAAGGSQFGGSQGANYLGNLTGFDPFGA